MIYQSSTSNPVPKNLSPLVKIVRLKSHGHLVFTEDHEYTRHGDDVYKTKIDADFDPDGNRYGLRRVCDYDYWFKFIYESVLENRDSAFKLIGGTIYLSFRVSTIVIPKSSFAHREWSRLYDGVDFRKSNPTYSIAVIV